MRMTRLNKVLLVLVVTGLALALRAYDLDAAGLAEDEVNKVVAARAYLRGDFSKNLEHPMLMKLMIAGSLVATDAWNAIASVEIPEEVPVRFPNVVAGTLMTVAIFAFASLYFGTSIGAVAAFFWAVSPLAITVNRVAKEDTLLILFVWLAFYFYERAKRLGAADTPKQRRLYLFAGASLGLMLASKYFPHYWGLLFLFYYLVGTDETNQPTTRSAHLAFYGAFVGFAILFNPTVLLPQTWAYFLDYTGEKTVSHHGYLFMNELYPNSLSATPGGLPIYFYAVMLALKTALPVLVGFVVGLAVAVRRRSERGMFFLLYMFVWWIVPFSLIAGKWIRYVVFLLPFFYVLSAIGVVEMARALARRLGLAPARVALAAVCAFAFVAVPLYAAVSAAPYYSLYLNGLGKGRVGYYFPHDEFYDAGLREAIARVAAEAPPNAVVLGEAPPVFDYYSNRFGRGDLRFQELSELAADRATPEASYVIVQQGRLYFENVDFIKRLEAERAADVTIHIAGAPSTRIYRLSDRAPGATP